MNYVIIRHAVLMEDEGRAHAEKVCTTLQDAMKWVAAQEDEYFKPGDYYIQEVPE